MISKTQAGKMHKNKKPPGNPGGAKLWNTEKTFPPRGDAQ